VCLRVMNRDRCIVAMPECEAMHIAIDQVRNKSKFASNMLLMPTAQFAKHYSSSIFRLRYIHGGSFHLAHVPRAQNLSRCTLS